MNLINKRGRFKIFPLFLLFLFSLNLLSQRIITLAPALTEIVFSLGMGNHIVGNTKFCDYPEEAKKIEKIGGFIDLNIEKVISLKPDIIILYKEHLKKLKFLKPKVNLVVVNHNTLDDIFNSIEIISKELNLEKKGSELIKKIKNELNQIRDLSKNKKRKRVLIIASRNPYDLKNMYIIGRKDYLNSLLEIAGGINVYSGSISYPSVSIENIISFSPDYILELSNVNPFNKKKNLFEYWKRYSFLKAVKNKKVFLIEKSYWLRPSVRIVKVCKEMYNILNDRNK